MYTLYGHEGASTAACFSTYGDFFATGGKDTVVQLWKSNIGINRGEVLEGIKMDSADQQTLTSYMEKVPDAWKVAKDWTVLDEATKPPEEEPIEEEPPVVKETRKTLSYKEIPSELTNTFDKIVFQLDLLSKTVLALEQRQSSNEDKLNEMIEYL